MTVREIIDYSKAYNARVENKIKVNATLIYKLGQLNTYAFNQPNKMPKINDIFPEMFKEESHKQDKQDWKIMKARIMQYGQKRKLLKNDN